MNVKISYFTDIKYQYRELKNSHLSQDLETFTISYALKKLPIFSQMITILLNSI